MIFTSDFALNKYHRQCNSLSGHIYKKQRDEVWLERLEKLYFSHSYYSKQTESVIP